MGYMYSLSPYTMIYEKVIQKLFSIHPNTGEYGAKKTHIYGGFV